MELAAFSDRGIGTRERLEDYAADRIITTAGGLELQVGLVSDGAGGGEAGELAARLTSRTIFEYLEISTETSIPQLLIRAVEQANKAVYDELRGAGTGTVALAAVHLNDESAPYGRLYIAHVGNSRVYLMREGHLVRLNIDHTLANEYVYAGQMSFEEARQLDASDYVTRSIGIGAEVNVDIGFYAERGKDFVNSRRAFRIGQKGMKLQEGDTVFTASDGLFPYINEEEFLKHALDDNVERATRTLIKYAADRGPEDNIALSVVFVPSRNRKTVRTIERFNRNQRVGIGVFSLAILLLIGFLGIQVAGGESQRVAFQATQTVVQQLILQSLYTPTSLPSPTPTQPVVAGQVGNRFSPSQQVGLAVFAGRYIDPLQPDEINRIEIAGANALSGGQDINRANLYLQPGSSIRLNQVIDAPGSAEIDLILKRGGDLFVNPGAFGSGGISIGLEQNPDMRLQSQSACMSVRQISADPSKPDTDKVALTCYGGSCTYSLPGVDPESVPSGQQVLLDVDNQQLISTAPIDQAQVESYAETIYQLAPLQRDQLNCLSSWLDDDGDGVNYPIDQCPAESAPGTNDGCPAPDFDEDGLVGNADLCPDVAGSPENDGCPSEVIAATQRNLQLTQIAGIQKTPTPTLTATPTLTPTLTPTPTATLIPLPQPRDDSYATLGNEILNIPAPGVLANDILHQSSLAPVNTTTTKGGTVTLRGDGSFTYSPPEDFVGLDSFEYTLTGVNGSTTGQVTIEVLQPPPKPPIAGFLVSTTSTTVGSPIGVINTSTGPINSYDWDFGDGSPHNISSSPDPHTYIVAGMFTISLTVSGPGGSDTISQSVTISEQPPQACFGPTNSTIVVGSSVGFNAGCSEGNIDVYRWTFGDGNSDLGVTPTHQYTNQGTFNVTLTVTGPGGETSANGTVIVQPPAPVACIDTPSWNVPVGTTITFTTTCSQNTTGGTFTWSFSDGNNPAPGQTAQHTYNTAGNNFSVTLTVTVPNAGSSQATGHVTVYTLPIACFNYSPTVIPPNTPVMFDAGCSNSPTGTTYSWNFGHGANGSGITASHPYPAGTYTITLTLTEPNKVPVQTSQAITVAPLPVAVDDQYSVDMDDTLDVDTSNDVLTNDTLTGTGAAITSNTNTNHGTLNFSRGNGTFSYTPDAGFAGPDSFTYTLTSPSGGTDTGNVIICVNPIAVNNFYSTTAGSGLNVPAPGILGNDTIPTSGTTITVTTTVPSGQGAIAVQQSGGFTYTSPTAAPPFAGTVTFNYTVSVSANGVTCTSAPATVTLSVGVNSPPNTFNDSYIAGVNTTLTVAAPGVLSNDTDENGDLLLVDLSTLTALTLNPTNAGGNGTLTFNDNGSGFGDGGFTYTPPAGYVGTVRFRYNVTDGIAGDSSGSLVTISVGVNVAPIANPNSYITPINATLTIGAPGLLDNDTDANGDTLTVNGSTVSGLTLNPTNGGQNGTLTVNPSGDGGFTYVPPNNYVGTVTFSYRANDGTVNSGGSAATVTITVGTPTAANDTYNVQFNTTLNVAAPGVRANDLPANGVSAILLSLPFNGTLTSFDANGSFNYVPFPFFSGSDSFYYGITNGVDFSNIALVTINVSSGSNLPPTADNDNYNTPVDQLLTVAAPGVLNGDTDPNGDPLTAFAASLPANGTLAFNPDGSFTYMPNAGFVGVDTFGYQASDGISFSEIATVTIDVGGTGGNSPPVANNDTYATTSSRRLNVAAPGVLTNDEDDDNDQLLVDLTTVTDPPHGTLTLNADGSFTYVSDRGFRGRDSFTYRAFDGTQNSNVATVTIAVSVPPPPPVAIEVPAPPPATRCTDTNFENPGMIRSHFLDDVDRANLFCRLIAAGGNYMFWLGSPITNGGNIGSRNVIDLGLIAAVDVFSMSGVTEFVNDVDICLQGSGYIIYMNVSGQPRVPQLWSAWTTPSFPGYTCTTLYAPGTVILVANKP